MKDAYEVLRQKELEVARVKQEIAALLLIVPLLNEDSVVPSSSVPRTQPDLQALRR